MLYAAFTITIFLSSFLLFLVQPMMAKMLLPAVGGAPAVWNTAMAFYQLCLLGGYAYAHFARHLISPLKLGVVHVALLALALLALPVSLAQLPGLDPVTTPIGWLLLNLTLSIGLPFLLLSSHAPLLQHFFSHADHPAARNPYLLYAASNAGSMLGLFAYPLVAEPFFTLPEQSLGWTFAYGLLVAMIAACLWLLKSRYVALPAVAEDDIGGVPLKRCLYWMLLAFVPSSLLLGVTSFITTDIAAVPLLWVLPLAIYLLTFILVFGDRMRGYRHALALHVPLVIVIALITCFGLFSNSTGLMLLHLLLFYAIAMVCHGQLALSKPSPRHLTTFYLCLSLGGAMGGTFNALIAPVIFDNVYEYVILLVAATFLLPRLTSLHETDWVRVVLWPVALVVAFFTIALAVDQLQTHFAGLPFDWFGRWIPEDYAKWQFASVVMFFAVTAWVAWKSYRLPFSLGLVVAVIYLSNYVLFAESNQGTLYTARNFFGVSRVSERQDPPIRSYLHGTTLHGIQPLEESKRLNPTSYYYPLKEIVPQITPRTHRVAVAGLGIGTLACAFGQNVTVDMYEIDPIVIELAQNEQFFTYLRDCPPKKKLILGDARLKLAEAPDGAYDLIVLDAYSSDSLPIHLITREAMALYARKLAPEGVLAYNLSNRHMQLPPVIANIADSLDLYAIERLYFPPKDDKYTLPAQWMLIGKERWSVNHLVKDGSGWKVSVAPDTRPWTDDYSNVVEAIWYRYGKRIMPWLAGGEETSPTLP